MRHEWRHEPPAASQILDGKLIRTIQQTMSPSGVAIRVLEK